MRIVDKAVDFLWICSGCNPRAQVPKVGSSATIWQVLLKQAKGTCRRDGNKPKREWTCSDVIFCTQSRLLDKVLLDTVGLAD